MTEPPPGWAPPGGEPVLLTTPPTADPPLPRTDGPAYGPAYGEAPARPGVIPLRPLTIGEILDGAVQVVRRYPRPALGMSALVALVTTVLGVLAVLAEDMSSLATDVRSGNNDSGLNSSAWQGATSAPAALIGGLAGIVLTGVLVVVVGKAVLGQETTFAETWQQVRPRVLPLLGLALLTGLVAAGPMVVTIGVVVALAYFVGLWTLAIGVPLGLASVALGVHLYVRLGLSSAALVLEKAGVRASMRRSAGLVKGSWWRVAGILMLIQLIASIVSGVLSVPFVAIAGVRAATDPAAGSFTALFVLSQVGAGIASFLVTPFAAGARALLYVDRRMRAEGLDLALQAAARR